MAGPAATGITSIASTIATALGSLSPGQTLLLGGHLTSSNEAKAIQYIEAMLANPVTAASFLPLLGAIPNLPAQVMTWVSVAVASVGTPTFQTNLLQAQIALQNQMATENALQQAFGI